MREGGGEEEKEEEGVGEEEGDWKGEGEMRRGKREGGGWGQG